MKKRGLSEVVAVLGIVLVTFAAVVLLIGFIVPYVKTNLNKGSECLSYREYFIFERENGFNCFNQENGEYWISVRAKTIDNESASKIGGFKISFNKQTENEVVSISDGSSEANVRMVYGNNLLTVPKGGEIKTYAYRSVNTFSRAEIYPVLSSGRVCEMSDYVDLGARCE